jgi:hypothetical protein
MFDPDIWKAAQLVTQSREDPKFAAASAGKRSKRGKNLRKYEPEPPFGFPLVGGAIETISTYHKPWGLMSGIIDAANAHGKKVFHWCILDVLQHCPQERDCGSCPLSEDCQKVAKEKCHGFYPIDDAIASMHRVSRDTWETEMLCRKPSTAGSVFPSFNPEIHVRETPPSFSRVACDALSSAETTLAIDFGFHNPFVCLWIVDDGVRCHVVDEYVQQHQIIAQHVEQIESRAMGKVRRICCDPAGAGRNDQTAESNVQYLRRHGYKVYTRHSRIMEGLEMIRHALCPAAGDVTLFIHPKCKRLIAAMQKYHYPPGGGEVPAKDGEHDHLVDALRYFYVNRSVHEVKVRERY